MKYKYIAHLVDRRPNGPVPYGFRRIDPYITLYLIGNEICGTNMSTSDELC